MALIAEARHNLEGGIQELIRTAQHGGSGGGLAADGTLTSNIAVTLTASSTGQQTAHPDISIASKQACNKIREQLGNLKRVIQVSCQPNEILTGVGPTTMPPTWQSSAVKRRDIKSVTAAAASAAASPRETAISLPALRSEWASAEADQAWKAVAAKHHAATQPHLSFPPVRRGKTSVVERKQRLLQPSATVPPSAPLTTQSSPRGRSRHKESSTTWGGNSSVATGPTAESATATKTLTQLQVALLFAKECIQQAATLVDAGLWVEAQQLFLDPIAGDMNTLLQPVCTDAIDLLILDTDDVGGGGGGGGGISDRSAAVPGPSSSSHRGATCEVGNLPLVLQAYMHYLQYNVLEARILFEDTLQRDPCGDHLLRTVANATSYVEEVAALLQQVAKQPTLMPLSMVLSPAWQSKKSASSVIVGCRIVDLFRADGSGGGIPSDIPIRLSDVCAHTIAASSLSAAEMVKALLSYVAYHSPPPATREALGVAKELEAVKEVGYMVEVENVLSQCLEALSGCISTSELDFTQMTAEGTGQCCSLALATVKYLPLKMQLYGLLQDGYIQRGNMAAAHATAIRATSQVLQLIELEYLDPVPPPAAYQAIFEAAIQDCAMRCLAATWCLTATSEQPGSDGGMAGANPVAANAHGKGTGSTTAANTAQADLRRASRDASAAAAANLAATSTSAKCGPGDTEDRLSVFLADCIVGAGGPAGSGAHVAASLPHSGEALLELLWECLAKAQAKYLQYTTAAPASITAITEAATSASAAAPLSNSNATSALERQASRKEIKSAASSARRGGRKASPALASNDSTQAKMTDTQNHTPPPAPLSHSSPAVSQFATRFGSRALTFALQLLQMETHSALSDPRTGGSTSTGPTPAPAAPPAGSEAKQRRGSQYRQTASNSTNPGASAEMSLARCVQRSAAEAVELLLHGAAVKELTHSKSPALAFDGLISAVLQVTGVGEASTDVERHSNPESDASVAKSETKSVSPPPVVDGILAKNPAATSSSFLWNHFDGRCLSRFLSYKALFPHLLPSPREAVVALGDEETEADLARLLGASRVLWTSCSSPMIFLRSCIALTEYVAQQRGIVKGCLSHRLRVGFDVVTSFVRHLAEVVVSSIVITTPADMATLTEAELQRKMLQQHESSCCPVDSMPISPESPEETMIRLVVHQAHRMTAEAFAAGPPSHDAQVGPTTMAPCRRPAAHLVSLLKDSQLHQRLCPSSIVTLARLLGSESATALLSQADMVRQTLHHRAATQATLSGASSQRSRALRSSSLPAVSEEAQYASLMQYVLQAFFLSRFGVTEEQITRRASNVAIGFLQQIPPVPLTDANPPEQQRSNTVRQKCDRALLLLAGPVAGPEAAGVTTISPEVLPLLLSHGTTVLRVLDLTRQLLENHLSQCSVQTMDPMPSGRGTRSPLHETKGRSLVVLQDLFTALTRTWVVVRWHLGRLHTLDSDLRTRQADIELLRRRQEDDQLIYGRATAKEKRIRSTLENTKPQLPAVAAQEETKLLRWCKSTTMSSSSSLLQQALTFVTLASLYQSDAEKQQRYVSDAIRSLQSLPPNHGGGGDRVTGYTLYKPLIIWCYVAEVCGDTRCGSPAEVDEVQRVLYRYLLRPSAPQLTSSVAIPVAAAASLILQPNWDMLRASSPTALLSICTALSHFFVPRDAGKSGQDPCTAQLHGLQGAYHLILALDVMSIVKSTADTTDMDSTALTMGIAEQLYTCLIPCLEGPSSETRTALMPPLLSLANVLLSAPKESYLWRDSAVQLLAVRILASFKDQLLLMSSSNTGSSGSPSKADASSASAGLDSHALQPLSLYTAVFCSCFAHVWNAVYCAPNPRQHRYIQAAATKRATVRRVYDGHRTLVHKSTGADGETGGAAAAANKSPRPGPRTPKRNAKELAAAPSGTSGTEAGPTAEDFPGLHYILLGHDAATAAASSTAPATISSGRIGGGEVNESILLHERMPAEYMELLEEVLFAPMSHSRRIYAALLGMQGLFTSTTATNGASRNTSTLGGSRHGPPGASNATRTKGAEEIEDKRPRSGVTADYSGTILSATMAGSGDGEDGHENLQKYGMRLATRLLQSIGACSSLAPGKGLRGLPPIYTAVLTAQEQLRQSHGSVNVLADILSGFRDDPAYAKLSMLVVRQLLQSREEIPTAFAVARQVIDAALRQGAANWDRLKAFFVTIEKEMQQWLEGNGYVLMDGAAAASANATPDGKNGSEPSPLGSSDPAKNKKAASKVKQTSPEAKKPSKGKRSGSVSRKHNGEDEDESGADEGGRAWAGKGGLDGNIPTVPYTTVVRVWSPAERQKLKQLTCAIAWQRRRRAAQLLLRLFVQYNHPYWAQLHLHSAALVSLETEAKRLRLQKERESQSLTRQNDATSNGGGDVDGVKTGNATNNSATLARKKSTLQRETPAEEPFTMGNWSNEELAATVQIVGHCLRAATYFSNLWLPNYAYDAIQIAIITIRNNISATVLPSPPVPLPASKSLMLTTEHLPSGNATVASLRQSPVPPDDQSDAVVDVIDGDWARALLTPQEIDRLREITPQLEQLAKVLLYILAAVHYDYFDADRDVHVRLLQPSLIKTGGDAAWKERLRFHARVPSLLSWATVTGQQEESLATRCMCSSEAVEQRRQVQKLIDCVELEATTRTVAEEDQQRGLAAILHTLSASHPIFGNAPSVKEAMVACAEALARNGNGGQTAACFANTHGQGSPNSDGSPRERVDGHNRSSISRAAEDLQVAFFPFDTEQLGVNLKQQKTTKSSGALGASTRRRCRGGVLTSTTAFPEMGVVSQLIGIAHGLYLTMPLQCVSICKSANELTSNMYVDQLLPSAIATQEKIGRPAAVERQLMEDRLQTIPEGLQLLEAARSAKRRLLITRNISETKAFTFPRKNYMKRNEEAPPSQKHQSQTSPSVSLSAATGTMRGGSTKAPSLKSVMALYQRAAESLRRSGMLSALGECLYEIGNLITTAAPSTSGEAAGSAMAQARKHWLDALDCFLVTSRTFEAWHLTKEVPPVPITSTTDQLLWTLTTLASLAQHAFAKEQAKATDAIRLAASLVQLRWCATTANVQAASPDAALSILPNEVMTSVEPSPWRSGTDGGTPLPSLALPSRPADFCGVVDVRCFDCAVDPMASLCSGTLPELLPSTVCSILEMAQRLLRLQYPGEAAMMAALAEHLAMRYLQNVDLTIEARLIRAVAAAKLGSISTAMEVLLGVFAYGGMVVVSKLPSLIGAVLGLHTAVELMISGSSVENVVETTRKTSSGRTIASITDPSGGNAQSANAADSHAMAIMQRYNDSELPSATGNVAAVHEFVHCCLPRLTLDVLRGSAPPSSVMQLLPPSSKMEELYGVVLTRRVILALAEVLVDLGSCDSAYLCAEQGTGRAAAVPSGRHLSSSNSTTATAVAVATVTAPFAEGNACSAAGAYAEFLLDLLRSPEVASIATPGNKGGSVAGAPARNLSRTSTSAGAKSRSTVRGGGQENPSKPQQTSALAEVTKLTFGAIVAPDAAHCATETLRESLGVIRHEATLLAAQLSAANGHCRKAVHLLSDQLEELSATTVAYTSGRYVISEGLSGRGFGLCIPAVLAATSSATSSPATSSIWHCIDYSHWHDVWLCLCQCYAHLRQYADLLLAVDQARALCEEHEDMHRSGRRFLLYQVTAYLQTGCVAEAEKVMDSISKDAVATAIFANSGRLLTAAVDTLDSDVASALQAWRHTEADHRLRGKSDNGSAVEPWVESSGGSPSQFDLLSQQAWTVIVERAIQPWTATEGSTWVLNGQTSRSLVPPLSISRTFSTRTLWNLHQEMNRWVAQQLSVYFSSSARTTAAALRRRGGGNGTDTAKKIEKRKDDVLLSCTAVLEQAIQVVSAQYDTAMHSSCLVESQFWLARIKERQVCEQYLGKDRCQGEETLPSCSTERSSPYDPLTPAPPPLTTTDATLQVLPKPIREACQQLLDVLPAASQSKGGVHHHRIIHLTLLEIATLVTAYASSCGASPTAHPLALQQLRAVAASCTILAALVADMERRILTCQSSLQDYASDPRLIGETEEQLTARWPDWLLAAVHRTHQAMGHLSVSSCPTSTSTTAAPSPFYAHPAVQQLLQLTNGPGTGTSASNRATSSSGRDGSRRVGTGYGAQSAAATPQPSSSSVFSVPSLALAFATLQQEHQGGLSSLSPTVDALQQDTGVQLLTQYLQRLTTTPNCTYLCYSDEERGVMADQWRSLVSQQQAANPRGTGSGPGRRVGGGVAAAVAATPALTEVDLWKAFVPPLLLEKVPEEIFTMIGPDFLGAPLLNSVAVSSLVSSAPTAPWQVASLLGADAARRTILIAVSPFQDTSYQRAPSLTTVVEGQRLLPPPAVMAAAARRRGPPSSSGIGFNTPAAPMATGRGRGSRQVSISTVKESAWWQFAPAAVPSVNWVLSDRVQELSNLAAAAAALGGDHSRMRTGEGTLRGKVSGLMSQMSSLLADPTTGSGVVVTGRKKKLSVATIANELLDQGSNTAALEQAILWTCVSFQLPLSTVTALQQHLQTVLQWMDKHEELVADDSKGDRGGSAGGGGKDEGPSSSNGSTTISGATTLMSSPVRHPQQQASRRGGSPGSEEVSEASRDGRGALAMALSQAANTLQGRVSASRISISTSIAANSTNTAAPTTTGPSSSVAAGAGSPSQPQLMGARKSFALNALSASGNKNSIPAAGGPDVNSAAAAGGMWKSGGPAPATNDLAAATSAMQNNTRRDQRIYVEQHLDEAKSILLMELLEGIVYACMPAARMDEVLMETTVERLLPRCSLSREVVCYLRDWFGEPRATDGAQRCADGGTATTAMRFFAPGLHNWMQRIADFVLEQQRALPKP